MKRREASGMAAMVLGLIALVLLGLAYYSNTGWLPPPDPAGSTISTAPPTP